MIVVLLNAIQFELLTGWLNKHRRFRRKVGSTSKRTTLYLLTSLVERVDIRAVESTVWHPVVVVRTLFVSWPASVYVMLSFRLRTIMTARWEICCCSCWNYKLSKSISSSE